MKTGVEKHLEALGLDSIDRSVDELVRLCKELQEENHQLRAQLSVVLSERAELLDRNDVARERVESIISRLKDLEGHA